MVGGAFPGEHVRFGVAAAAAATAAAATFSRGRPKRLRSRRRQPPPPPPPQSVPPSEPIAARVLFPRHLQGTGPRKWLGSLATALAAAPPARRRAPPAGRDDCGAWSASDAVGKPPSPRNRRDQDAEMSASSLMKRSRVHPANSGKHLRSS